jgi:hypothetical protein
MDIKRLSSRSVIVDNIYDKFRINAYNLHKKKINEIKDRKFSDNEALKQSR